MGVSWKTLSLAAVVIALAVWIFVFDLPGERREIEDGLEAARLLPIDPAAVDTLQIDHPQYPVTIVRRDDAWRITRPIDEAAETRAVRSTLERLTQLASERTMVPSLEAGSWASYGLAEGHPGRADLILASSDGRRIALAVGNPVVTGDYVYVRRLDSDALEVADSWLFDIANATHHGFRRVDLFELSASDVTRLSFEGPGGRWSAVRDSTTGLWSAGATRLKRWILDDLALAVSEQTVQAFLRDGLTEADWAAYGLDAPWAAVTVLAREGREQTLWFGNEREADQYFARKRGLDTVMIVRPRFVDALDAGTVGLENTNPIPVNLKRATAFRVEDHRGRWGRLRAAGMDWELEGSDGAVESTTYRQTAADNIARGLEEMQPARSIYLPSGEEPAGLFSERIGRVTIEHPTRGVDVHFGWRDGEDQAWFYFDGDATLYEVDRGMVLRLHSFVDALYADDSRPD